MPKAPKAIPNVPRVWLKDFREAMKLSQAATATACYITQAHFCNIENGKKGPTPKVAKRIGEVLGFEWTRFYE